MSASHKTPPRSARFDYKAQLLAKADIRAGQRAAADRKTYNRLARYQFACDPPFLAALRSAASLRGISVAAYVRRAIGAFVSADLGVEFTEIMRHTAQAADKGKWARRQYDAEGGQGARTARHTKDDGRGFGPWVASGVGGHDTITPDEGGLGSDELDDEFDEGEADPRDVLRVIDGGAS